MNFNPTTCPDCSYPPNFIITEFLEDYKCPSYYSIKCRDCGDIWDEPAEIFSENTDSDEE